MRFRPSCVHSSCCAASQPTSHQCYPICKNTARHVPQSLVQPCTDRATSVRGKDCRAAKNVGPPSTTAATSGGRRATQRKNCVFCTSRRELAEAMALQLRVCRCKLQLWPRQSDKVPTYFRRIARCCDRVNLSAKVPRWDTSQDWQPETTHADCQESRIDTEALRGLLWRSSDPTRSRLGIQCMGGRGNTMGRPHQSCMPRPHNIVHAMAIAQAKAAVDATQVHDIQKHARATHDHATLPRGRWTIGETPWTFYRHIERSHVSISSKRMHTVPPNAVTQHKN